jgi:hypothetical protein
MAALLNGTADSAGGAQYQILQIQEMLGFKLLPGPFAGWLQFDTDEIADLTVDAIAHNSGQLIAGTLYIQMCANGQRNLELQTHPGWGDVLQQGSGFAFTGRGFFPTDFYHVCAQHPNFSASSLHDCYIGGMGGWH